MSRVWWAIHATALVTGGIFLAVLALPVIVDGNMSFRARQFEQMNARDTIVFLLMFGSLVASALRSLFLEAERDQ